MGDKSTPTPWKVFTTPDGTKVVGIGELTGEGVADAGFGIWRDGAEAMANAALIVKAVNRDHLFDELVEALEEAAEAINAYQQPALQKVSAVLTKVNSHG